MVCKEHKNLKGGLILCIIRPRKHKKHMKKREKTPAAYLLYKGVKVRIALMAGTNDKAEVIKYNFFYLL